MQIITQKYILKSKNVDTILVIIFVKIKNIINIKKSTEIIIPNFYVRPIKNNLRPLPCAQCCHDPYGAHHYSMPPWEGYNSAGTTTKMCDMNLNVG